MNGHRTWFLDYHKTTPLVLEYYPDGIAYDWRLVSMRDILYFVTVLDESLASGFFAVEGYSSLVDHMLLSP